MLAFVLTVSLVASTALAQRVVLVRPASSDEQALAAFAHLQGELTVHAFEVGVVDPLPVAPRGEQLERLANTHSAQAVVVLLRDGERVQAILWVREGARGRGLEHALEMSLRSAEGPRALAIQAVDMLRANASKPDTKLAPAVAAPPVVPTPIPPTPPAPARAKFVLEGGVLGQLDRASVGLALGPSLAVGLRVSTRLALLAVVQAPLRGAEHAAQGASVSISQEQMLAELRMRLWSSRRLALDALASVGTQHLSVRGNAAPPYLPEHDAAWTALVGAGLGAELRLLGPLSLCLRTRSLVLLPRPVVHVASEHVALGRPLFQLAMGLHVAL
jgi:hypothetical protein